LFKTFSCGKSKSHEGRLLPPAFIGMVIYAVATPSRDGWKKIDDHNDSDIKDIGSWAVDNHNRVANDQPVFQNVVEARQENSSQGFYHDLVIRALGAVHTTHNYEASVFIIHNVDDTIINLLSFNASDVLI
jgi:hypothetical protein